MQLPEDLVYNPAWFQQEQSSGFEPLVNQSLESQQQETQQQAYSGAEGQQEMLDMFTEMKNALEEMQQLKQTYSLEKPEQVEDDFSDLEDYKVIFGDDDVNTPVDWEARSASLEGNTIAATHNNPGNLKYADWMAQYGAVPGKPGTDGGRFAKFQNVNSGLAAREYLLKSRYGSYDIDTGLKRYSNKGYGAEIYPQIKGKTFNDLTEEEFHELTRRQIQREDANVYKQLYEKPKYTTSKQAFNPLVKSKAVQITNVNPQLKDWYSSISPLYGGLTVTSGTDGQHTKGSKHYSGNALDVRIWDYPGQKLLNDVKTKGTFLQKQSRGDVYSFNGAKVLIEKDHLHINL